MNHNCQTFAITFIVLLIPTSQAAEPAGQRFIEPNDKTGTSQAVVVDPVPLAHTAQLLALDGKGQIVGKDDPEAQIQQVLHNLEAALAAAGSGMNQTVKINVYVRRAKLVPAIQDAISWRFKGDARPAVSYVEGALPHPDALVAMDAVGAVPKNGPSEVKRLQVGKLPGGKNNTHVAILPAGPHVYISGQAIKGDDLAQSAQKTMASLRETLKFLGLNKSQVVHVKSFLKPMSAVGDAEKEIIKFFGEQPAPPMTFVEWTMTLPIEIELVVAAPQVKEKPVEPIEFLTPPGVTPSPVYSRVARINHGKLVYVSGLYGKTPDKPEAQIHEVFASLEALLKKAGSDFRHLAKATYYVSDDVTSQKLNELRPKYYDPRRPPAASKAVVPGVAQTGRSITLDMIAVTP